MHMIKKSRLCQIYLISNVFFFLLFPPAAKKEQLEQECWTDGTFHLDYFFSLKITSQKIKRPLGPLAKCMCVCVSARVFERQRRRELQTMGFSDDGGSGHPGSE